MADLLEDHSPLQINTQGRYKGGNFVIVGRVQYQYAEGIWNEWHILFSNGKSGWLSEASGSYVISFQVPKFETHANLSSYGVNDPIVITGQQFRVVGIESAKCIAGEGEIPFKIIPGEINAVIDCTNQTAFASINFSEIPPLLFLGEQVELHTLSLKNLKEQLQSSPNVKVKSFNCPSCASPIEVNSLSSKSIVCGACTAVLDVSNKNVEILKKYQTATHIKPRIELGSVGSFEGADFRIIGFMRRQVVASPYAGEWDEYLLHNPTQGFRWLTASRGHWNYVKPLQKSPTVSKSWSGTSTNIFLYENYKHFEKYRAKVSFVMGEFYWRVSLDDAAEINDYVAPPSILSQETSKKEVTWSQGEYLTTAEVEEAFKHTFSLPEPSGISANQPSQYQQESLDFLQAMAGFMMIGLILQLCFVLTASNRVVLDTVATFSQSWGESPSFSSEPFTIEGHKSNLIITQSTNIENTWVATDLVLVEKNTGKSYRSAREMGYYTGYDTDGRWSEGSQESEVEFSAIPAGEYYLIVEPSTEQSQKNEVYDHIKIYRNVPQWSNLFMLWLFLTIIPCIIYYLKYRFEVKRWENSDHPLISYTEE